MTKLRVLSLFAGIGGMELGLERTGGFETVAQCEIDPFCRKVLAKHWPHVKRYEDVRTLTADALARDGIGVDVITGGFPCQDISSAGYKVGIGGQRSGLWSEYSRLIGELRPSYVLVENVAALLSRGLDVVLGDLAQIGYDAEWHCIPASAVGAPHQRDRVWIIANPNNQSKSVSAKHDETRGVQEVGNVIHAECRFIPLGLHLGRIGRFGQPLPWDRVWEGENSPLGLGMVDGVPQRLDRLRSLGNAVVPQIPELIGRAILEARRAA